MAEHNILSGHEMMRQFGFSAWFLADLWKSGKVTVYCNKSASCEYPHIGKENGNIGNAGNIYKAIKMSNPNHTALQVDEEFNRFIGSNLFFDAAEVRESLSMDKKLEDYWKMRRLMEAQMETDAREKGVEPDQKAMGVVMTEIQLLR